jgi:pyrophosphatase PpaX
VTGDPLRGLLAVFFDLDGTLVDSTELILSSHEHALRRHLDGRCPDRRALVRNIGRPLAAGLLEYARAAGCADPAGVAAAMLETYRACQREAEPRLMRVVPGIRAVVMALGTRGYRLGVVTSKSEAVARPALERYGLTPLLPITVFLEDTTRHKPDAAPLLEAARRGGFDPGGAAYVGDSTHDMEAGRAAGMTTIAALWGPFDREDLLRLSPDALAERPEDLLRLLPGP